MSVSKGADVGKIIAIIIRTNISYSFVVDYTRTLYQIPLLPILLPLTPGILITFGAVRTSTCHENFPVIFPCFVSQFSTPCSHYMTYVL